MGGAHNWGPQYGRLQEVIVNGIYLLSMGLWSRIPQFAMGKRRRDKIEYYDDVVLSTGKAILTSPAPVQHIQQQTKISSWDATLTTVKTNQIYYSVMGPPLQQCSSQVIEEIQWSTQPVPDGVESIFDEPINFVNPPTAIVELEIMDDNPRANRYLGVRTSLFTL